MITRTTYVIIESKKGAGGDYGSSPSICISNDCCLAGFIDQLTTGMQIVGTQKRQAAKNTRGDGQERHDQ